MWEWWEIALTVFVGGALAFGAFCAGYYGESP